MRWSPVVAVLVAFACGPQLGGGDPAYPPPPPTTTEHYEASRYAEHEDGERGDGPDDAVEDERDRSVSYSSNEQYTHRRNGVVVEERSRTKHAHSNGPTVRARDFAQDDHDAIEDDDRRDDRRGRGDRRRRGKRAFTASLHYAKSLCGRFTYAKDIETCETIVLDAYADPGEPLRACVGITNTYSDQLACLRAAVASAGDPSKTIVACGDTFNTYADRVACVEAGANLDPRTVRSCADVFNTYEQRKECVRLLADARREPSEVLRHCKDRPTYDARLECVRKYR
jgi:hypothetical protein